MLRAWSMRAGRGYEKLPADEEPGTSKLERARSLPAKIFNGSRKWNLDHQQKALEKSVSKEVKKVSKIHPMFNLMDIRLRRKATAKPEFSRYLQYLKEGGLYTISEANSTSLLA